MITQEILKSLLVYDPETGVFTNRVTRNVNAMIGKVAGTDQPDGYQRIKIFRKCYLSHRLAWLYVHGVWPIDQIDHINGIRNDNRLGNLRPVSQKENMENQKLHVGSKSGHRGVTWDTETGKWLAQVRHNTVIRKVGRFINLDDAVVAVKSARDGLFTHHRTEHSS